MPEIKHALIIAEAGVNHNGDLGTAFRLIDIAATAGADYVKFQTFRAEKLVSRNAQKASYQLRNMQGDTDTTQLSMLKKLELSPGAHNQLIKYCKGRNIRFLSTAFDLDTLDFLHHLGLDLFKIPSGELTNLPYLKKVGGFGKSLLLSTGMADMDEIEAAITVLEQAGAHRNRITVLHCNTEYPTPMEDVNLRAMLSIRDTFQVQVGYSDHTLGIEIPIAAVALGAVCIEKHFTVSRALEGPDHKASLEPDELNAMIAAIRNTEKAMGSAIKKPSASESRNISIARKSIHLASTLPAGHTLTEKDIIMKRPGDGISPMRMGEVIGKKLARPLGADSRLEWTDLLQS